MHAKEMRADPSARTLLKVKQRKTAFITYG
jgi:hypothetical protein